ncbi:DUF6443 domain-containing protein [Arcticibacter eurypsychrophilus]|uniref:DUF6443 domain-containing protein n=1 Tax=Arcticibacter eurypsychrophilus TaxID=1434752 RepID=UPI00084D4EFF|nr:DUF6443 domain-containing protein [Arcticibacter eurypsychrophilus]
MNYQRSINRLLILPAFLAFISNICLSQTTQVIDATISSYQGVSYQAVSSVTLKPGFNFAPSTANPSFSIIIKPLVSVDDPGLIVANNVRTDIIKVQGITNQGQISPANSQTKITYMDGLGRPVQVINLQTSPLQKDIVQLMEYDQYGQQPKQYLPFVSNTSSGAFHANPKIAQQTFYSSSSLGNVNDNFPYAVTSYDNSPLNRVMERGAPGADWQPGNHTVKMQFRLNTASDYIRIWTVDGPGAGNYAEMQLSVNDLVDENGSHVLSFTNKLGQLVEKKVEADAGEWLETVYIYDDLGNLVYQISPEGVKRLYAGNTTWGAVFTGAWASVYTYDVKGRLIAKQAPGVAPVFMVYDSYDRLVLLQDGRLRNAYGTADKWYFTKYDAANRAVLNGLYTYTDPATTGVTHREKLQAYLDALIYNNTTVFNCERRMNGTTYGYSNRSFPVSPGDADIITVNYYDDYDFNNDGSADYIYNNPGSAPYAAVATNDNSGFLTGVYNKVLGTSGWIKKTLFYDSFGNVIQKQNNSLLNANVQDITSNAYDIYAGHVIETKQVKVTAATVTVVSRLAYDLQDRLKQVAVKINGGTEQVIAGYEYNELGQLKSKKLHQKTTSTYLQTIDYRYNIRGWITSINNSGLTNDSGITNNDNSDVFGMTLLYNQADAGLANTPNYNGRLSAIKWKTNDQFSVSGNPVRERSYKYTYDKVDRLKGAYFAAKGVSAWDKEAGAYNETIGSYDNNGNILSLQRYIQTTDASGRTMIDNLTYSYLNNGSSNQLASVTDATASTMGFKDGAGTAAEYSYDTNGNLTGDANKGQTLTYNDLNKVSKITTAIGSVEYAYDANGSRINKIVYNAAHAVISRYDYLDGFVYNNNTLSYLGTVEGRVLAGSQYTYEYFIKDQQGNVRASFTDNGSGVAKITQENAYYAFGLTMQGIVVRTAQSSVANKQLYNGGSELQDDLGYESSYSTHYREYDPALGRFNAHDPMVDKYASWTPYNFAFNDPSNQNDPTGADPNDHVNVPPFWVAQGPPADWLSVDRAIRQSMYTSDMRIWALVNSPMYTPNSAYARIGWDMIMIPVPGAAQQQAASGNQSQNFLTYKKAYSNADLMKVTLSEVPITSWAQLRSRAEAAYDNYWADRGGDVEADGYLTLAEANEHYRNGNSTTLNVDLNRIDLSAIHSEDFNGVGSTKYFNLLLHSNSYNDGMVYGNVRFRLYPGNTVKAFSDTYDFDQKTWWNPLNWGRNIETVIGSSLAGPGTPYKINFNGSAEITPVHHVIK